MPYLMKKNNQGQMCIYKKNADGTAGEMVEGSCHADEKKTKAMMDEMMAAMKNEHVKQIGGSIDDFLSTVRRAFEETFNKNKQSDAWLWVRDVFEDHVIARDGEIYYEIPMTMSEGTVTFAPRTQWKKVTLEYVAQMAGDEHRAPIHEVMITEFKGKVPDVPTRPGINVEDLTEGDEKPFFLTMEISRKGKKSRSGLLHDEALGETIAQQINEMATTGIMGHLKDEERSTAFPTPDIYWLGASRVDGRTYAKGYIPKTKPDVREHFRIQMKVGGKAATSIYGAAQREMVDVKQGTHRLKNFRLEQLDLAPYERAALPLDGTFVITKQMDDGASSERNEAMEREELIKQLTSADIPQVLREQIVKEYAESNKTQTRVAELEGQVGQRDARIAELTTQLGTFQRSDFETKLTAKIAEMVELEPLRSTVRRIVVAELGKDCLDLAKAETAIKEYVETDDYKMIAKGVVAELAGPSAIIGGKGKGEDTKLVDTPEARAEARRKTGI